MLESPLLWCRFLDTSVISLGPVGDLTSDQFPAFVQESSVLFLSLLIHSYCVALCSLWMSTDGCSFFMLLVIVPAIVAISKCFKTAVADVLLSCSSLAQGTSFKLSTTQVVQNIMPNPSHQIVTMASSHLDQCTLLSQPHCVGLHAATWSELSLSSGPGETFCLWVCCIRLLELIPVLNACLRYFQVLGFPVLEHLPWFGKH